MSNTKWVTNPDELKVGDKAKIRLEQEGRMGESVWYEVVEILGDGKFKIKLLNQPFNIDLEWGDILEIEDKSYSEVPLYRVE